MKIAISLSGGVDSTLVTLILKKLKYDVYCFYFENNIFNEKKLCNSHNEIKKCIKIVQLIGAKIKIINTTKLFKNKIFLKLIKSYKKGYAINPDIICNKRIKFGFFIKKFKKKYMKFSFGHYVNKKNNNILIHKDFKRDQSYFMHDINKKYIKYIFFPLSLWKKKETKYINYFLNLKNNKSSKGICFIYNCNFGKYIKKFIKSKGSIINKNKKKISSYKNLYYQILGQRVNKKIGNKKNYIFNKKKKNIYVVNNSRNTLLYSRFIFVTNEKIIKRILNINLNEIFIKTNSQSQIKKGFLLFNNSILKIVFIYPLRKINKGQSVVIYNLNNKFKYGFIK
ncbi:adenine nucleotide alpha hydrolase family protein [Candidatus Vidania fulgoroideorum]